MRKIFFLLALLPMLSNCVHQVNTTIDLSGTWKFQIDSLDQGVTDKWFMSGLNDLIDLPGSMTTNGKGDEVSVDTRWTGGIVDSSWYKNEKYARFREPGNMKIPFWLQPVKYYAGAAWYQKTVHIPGDWKNMHIDLFLERCHWETRVWINDQEIGSQNSLATPHIYDLTNHLVPGSHTLTILVDNRIRELDPGINSHSIADHTQSNWNGIIGKIALEAKPKIYLSDVKIDTDVPTKTLLITGDIMNENKSMSKGVIELTTETGNPIPAGQKIKTVQDVEITESKTPFSIKLTLPDNSKLWDEFDPNLYTAILSLKTDAGTDSKEIRFGFRSFEINGTQFTINGRRTFLRARLNVPFSQGPVIHPQTRRSGKEFLK
jgi:beta-galactosidase/beta-glucuronidase